MIDENVLERLKPYLTEVSYPKGYVLFNSEKLERNIYFIKRGMARAFVEACPTDNKEAAMSLLHSFYCWGCTGVVLFSTVFFALFGTEHWKILTLL